VAPPYPGAFTQVGDSPARVLRTSHLAIPTNEKPGTLFVSGEDLFAACGDGSALPVFELEIAGERLDARTFSQRHGGRLRAAA
jgi:methionyl-tRNA formyltransferase